MQEAHQYDIPPNQPPRRFGSVFLSVRVVKNILHRRRFRHGTAVLLPGSAQIPVVRLGHCRSESLEVKGEMLLGQVRLGAGRERGASAAAELRARCSLRFNLSARWAEGAGHCCTRGIIAVMSPLAASVTPLPSAQFAFLIPFKAQLT